MSLMSLDTSVTLGGVIFYSSTTMAGFFFLKLAKDWPKLIKLFAEVEEIFHYDSYRSSTRWSMKKKMRIISVVLLTLALAEHLCYFISFLYDRYQQAMICDLKIGDIAGYIITTQLNHIFAKVPFNLITAVWFEYMNISFTFGWNFMDLFIILVSVGIAYRFQQLNERLKYFHGRVCFINSL